MKNNENINLISLSKVAPVLVSSLNDEILNQSTRLKANMPSKYLGIVRVEKGLKSILAI